MSARLAALLTLAVPLLAFAAGLEIEWFTIDGGGGTSSGGGLVVSGTVAQPDATPLAAGSFVLKGGFWAAPGVTATAVDESPATTILPSIHRFHGNAPNPFRERTSLRFDLPRPERATIRIYDVTGRLVETLVDGDLEAGSHEVAWDGRDRSGSRVASGVYLVRMQAGNYGATRKITHLD